VDNWSLDHLQANFTGSLPAGRGDILGNGSGSLVGQNISPFTSAEASATVHQNESATLAGAILHGH
jgi:hypothetical protein